MSLLALIAASTASQAPPAQSPIHEMMNRSIDWDTAQVLVDRSQIPGATQLREQDDIIYDPGATDPARRWCFYFSVSAASVDDSSIWVVHSADGAAWGTPVQCTVAGGSPLIGQDPSITQTWGASPVAYRDNDDLLVLFCENKTGSNEIDAYTSVDGTNWVLTGASVVAKTSGVDSSLVGSPCSRHDGNVFIVGYEGIQSTPYLESFSLAIGPTPTTLVKSPENPVIDPFSTSWLDQSVIVDSMWVTPDGSRVMLTAHGLTMPPMWRMATSNTDPTTWSQGDFTNLGSVVDGGVSDLTADYHHGRLVTSRSGGDELVSVALTS